MDQLITKNYNISPSKRQQLHDFRIIKSITEIFASDPSNSNKPPILPGVGKTTYTLAKEIAYPWAAKEILNDVIQYYFCYFFMIQHFNESTVL